MPDALAVLNLMIPVTFVLFHLAEVISPAQRLPRSIAWRVKGFLYFGLIGAIVGNLPMLWADVAARHHLLDLSWMGLWAFPLVVLVVEFIGYWLHRARHQVPFLWRFHQLHHAAERLDISGAFHFHPIEATYIAILGTVAGSFLLGVSPLAAGAAGLFGFFCACFQHANVRTPRWLGYVIQRPESHSIHHARGVHRFNYADLAVIDLVFGTFRNPAEREPEVGFYEGASGRIGSLLLGRDVSTAGSR